MNSSRHTVMFFSRGRGHGHALDAIDFLDQIHRQFPEFEFMIVSYATGAETFRSKGIQIIDLGLPQQNAFLATLHRTHSVLEGLCPALVVSHEEPAALVAANLLKIPSIFLSPWLPPQGTIIEESLQAAQSIVLMGDPGIFALPTHRQIPIHYTGHFVRHLPYGREDRASLRAQNGMPPSAPVITVVPGGWFSEKLAPLADIVLPAFQSLPQTGKQLFWLSTQDYEIIEEKCRGIPGAKPLKFADDISKLLAVSDVVVTKGTRGTTMEAAQMGVPSISVSFGGNPIDELLTPRIRTNVALNAKATTPEIFGLYLRKQLLAALDKDSAAPELDDGHRLAETLGAEMRRILAPI